MPVSISVALLAAAVTSPVLTGPVHPPTPVLGAIAPADTLEIVRWEEFAWQNIGGLDPEVWPTRALTGLFLSMYMAGVSVDDRYDLDVDLPSATGSADDAAAAAGRAYLEKFFQADVGDALPAPGDVDPPLDALAAAAADAAYELASRTVGDPVPYRPFAVAGRYVPTELPGDPMTAHLGHFSFDPARATEIAPPPSVNSDRHAADLNETRRLGGLESDERTEWHEKATIVFDAQYHHPMIHRLMEGRDLSLFEQARIMAIADMTYEDVLMAQFAGKLHFQSWRPITAIRRAELDGRDDTEVDPDWTPFLETPNSSEYPCGHCTGVAGLAGVLEAVLPLRDGDQIVIKPEDMMGSDPAERGFRGDAESFLDGFEIVLDSWDAFEEEGSMSRIYNGAHFRYSMDAGRALGRAIAATTLERWGGLGR